MQHRTFSRLKKEVTESSVKKDSSLLRVEIRNSKIQVGKKKKKCNISLQFLCISIDFTFTDTVFMLQIIPLSNLSKKMSSTTDGNDAHYTTHSI